LWLLGSYKLCNDSPVVQLLMKYKIINCFSSLVLLDIEVCDTYFSIMQCFIHLYNKGSNSSKVSCLESK
jgi:hypothetical protein